MTQIPKAINPNWEAIDRHAPWSHVTSRQLAKLLGVSLQTINNWKMREVLPEPEPQSRFKGNRNYYNVAKIRTWLEGKDEEIITWAWIRKYIPDYKLNTVPPAIDFVRVCYETMELERPLV